MCICSFVCRKEGETGSQSKVRIEIGEDGEEYNYDDQENQGNDFTASDFKSAIIKVS